MQTNHENKIKDIIQTIVLEAPIQKVWNTVSTAKGIETWFMPNDFKPIVGHEFHLQSPFGPSPCKVLEIEEPNRISFSWDTNGWIVTFILKEVNDKTEFTLIHAGWNEAGTLVPKANQESTSVRDKMDGGWSSIVHTKLKKAVEL